MADETEIRLARAPDGGGHPQGSGGIGSPLPTRAAFIKNWDWQLVTRLNQGSCDRGKALHGHNSETHERVRQRWEEHQELTLGNTLDFLLIPFHSISPEIARRIVDAIFIEFPLGRRREASSLAAHYVAGVLDRESMENGLRALAELADFKPGDRVKTLRGSTQGVIVSVLPDGRVAWRPDGSQSELIALPEGLLRA